MIAGIAISSPVISQTVNVTEFHIPQIPSIDGLIKSIGSVLDNLDEFSSDSVDNSNIHGRTILEQNHKFLSLTEDSINCCAQMAAYAIDFMEYVHILMDENVSVTDFTEAMILQEKTAASNRSRAAHLVEGYRDILIALQNVVNEMEDFTCQTGIEGELESNANQARKEQKVRALAAVGTGITTGAAIIAVPFTCGLSLAIIGALGLTSAGAMIGTSVTSVRYGAIAKLTESELCQINQIRINIKNAIKELKNVIYKFDGFDDFFEKEIENLTKVIERYETDENNVGMSRMKGTAIRKQWTRVKNVFEMYSMETRSLIEDRN